MKYSRNPEKRLHQMLAAFLIVVPMGNQLIAQNENTTEDIFEMDPFVVQTAQGNAYTTESSNSATLVAMQRDQIPFITSVVTEQLIEDLAMDNLADFAKLVAGVSLETNSAIADEIGQPAQTFRVRGFLSQPLYNGFRTGGRMSSVDNIGRIEVSKGPNSVLYGQSAGGGIINIIPKAPRFDEAHADFTAGIGNEGYRRASFDAGGPIAGDNVGKLAFRIGGGYTDYEREQIFFEHTTEALNAAVTWMPAKRVKLDVVAEYQQFDIIPSRTAAFVSVGSGPDRVIDPFNRLRNDRNFSYTGPFTNNKFETSIVSSYLTSKLADSLTLRIGGFWSQQVEDGRRFVGAFGLGTSETASSPFEKRDSTDIMRGYKIDLLHTMTLGGFTLDSLLGYERYNQNNDLFAIRTDRLSVTIPFSRRTIASDWPAPPPLNEFNNLRIDQRSSTETTNLRFSQVVTTEDGKGTLLWGVARGEGDATIDNRLSNQRDTLDGDDTTYTAGVSYKVMESEERSITLFANYSTSFLIQPGNQQNPEDFRGFTTVDELRDFVNNVQPNAPDPEEGDGYELGFRYAIPEQGLVASVAWFDQSRENIGRTFFVRENYVEGINSEDVLATFILASGEENIKGIELDLTWAPTPALTLLFGAAFADGEVVSNISAPDEVGLDLVRAPETMLNGWIKYTLQEGSLTGLSLGAGASYRDSTRVLPSLNDRYRISDSYTDVEALVRYDFTLMGLKQYVSLNIKNLLDDDWVDEANWLSNPRLYRFHYGVSW
jgi:iron complex outermembrane receptor protein